jgi:hypothetical protein
MSSLCFGKLLFCGIALYSMSECIRSWKKYIEDEVAKEKEARAGRELSYQIK